MERYKNLSGKSGILAYELGDDYIKIEFEDGATYLYTYTSTGKENVEAMKALAVQGEGLTTYINQYIRKGYEDKLG
jgi:hypothetical protein